MALENLLNALIKRGWKPFYWEIKSKWWVRGNYPCEWAIKIRKNTIFISYRYESWNEQITKWKKLQHSVRELTSKESWLWQFVCENGMANTIYRTWDKYDENDCPVPNQQHLDKYYEYRLIESSLKDEDDLEKFLLENILI